ncbi:MAG: DCC1-like thiol-disulfide oxidoreductase family protein [bacterium]
MLPNLILFDGVCVLCNGWARFVAGHDRAGVFRLATAQSDTGQRIYRQLGLSPVTFDTLVVYLDGRHHIDSDAILTVLTAFGGLWRAAAILRLIPGPLRDWAYRHIARRRYRLFGRHQACPMPTPEVRARLL